MDDLIHIRDCFLRPLNPKENISLFKGLAGDILLLKDLFLLTNDCQYEELLRRNVEYILTHIKDLDFFCLSNGLCGVLYALLDVSDVLEIQFPDTDCISDALLERAALRQVMGEYDLQTGLIGLGIFGLALCQRGIIEKEVTLLICNSICELLDEEQGIAFLPYKREIHPFFPAGRTWTNNGFLHGINSVLAFFLICIRDGIYCSTMVDWVKLISSNQLDFLCKLEESFPMGYCLSDSGTLVYDNRRSRLHYCTGDFGIINNLYLFSQIFGEQDYLLAARRAYMRVVQRFLAGEQCRMDCFCHGKAGLVFFLERFKPLVYNDFLANFITENKSSLVFTLTSKRHNPGILDGNNGIIMALLGSRINCSLGRVLLLQ